MKEIEVKAKAKSFDAIKLKLEKMGCVFTEPVIQDDTIFINFESKNFTRGPKGANYLRIRNSKGKSVFNIKQDVSNVLDRIEKEVEVADPKIMKQMIELLGYHVIAKVYKTRTKTKYKDVEICLDKVKGLGSFIEVEKMSNKDGEKVQEELFVFLESLGVKREDRVHMGYDILVYLKNK